MKSFQFFAVSVTKKARAGIIPTDVATAIAQKSFSAAQMGGEFFLIRKGQVRVANPSMYTTTESVADIAASAISADSNPWDSKA
mmetsp:Transcript_7769/g.19037  ORF Transcript_7769/g.19037 Transcript_7769/m.19037 type:complete len:84 (+) Transcript_7769:69-320(+)